MPQPYLKNPTAAFSRPVLCVNKCRVSRFGATRPAWRVFALAWRFRACDNATMYEVRLGICEMCGAPHATEEICTFHSDGTVTHAGWRCKPCDDAVWGPDEDSEISSEVTP